MKIFLTVICITLLGFEFVDAGIGNKALIIIDSKNYNEMQKPIDYLEKFGAKIVHIYPPKILIGYLPQSINTTNIFGVKEVFFGNIEESKMKGLDEVSKIVK